MNGRYGEAGYYGRAAPSSGRCSLGLCKTFGEVINVIPINFQARFHLGLRSFASALFAALLEYLFQVEEWGRPAIE